MEFDDALRKLGQFGRYQKLIYFVIGIATVQTTFSTLNIVFVAAVPDHWCASPELDHLNLSSNTVKNLTLPLVERDGEWVHSSCSRYRQNYSRWTIDDVLAATTEENRTWPEESCPNGWVYDRSTYTSTIVSEWDLVCEHQWLQATSSSVYMAGLMTGVCVITNLSDLFGRKPALMLATMLANTLAIVTSFATSYTMFVVIRFFAGLFNIGFVMVAFVIVVEVVGPDYRTYTGMGFQLFWAAAYMILTAFAYFVRDWSKFILTSALFAVPFAIPTMFIPESARWLYSRGYKEKGDMVMRRAARINKVVWEDNVDTLKQEAGEKGYMWDLCRSPSMAFMTAIICFLWLCCTSVYYGLTLGSSSLGGNDLVNFALSGGIEIPSYILALFVVRYGGRRWPLCVSYLIGGISLLCMLAVPKEMTWVSLSLSLFGKFGLTAAFAIIYMYTVELYPTVVRNVGIGIGSFSGRIGGVAAPIINQLAVYSKFLPVMIFGALSITAGLLTLLLPETKGKNLPETLEDGEKFARTIRLKKKRTPKDSLGSYLEVKDVRLHTKN